MTTTWAVVISRPAGEGDIPITFRQVAAAQPRPERWWAVGGGRWPAVGPPEGHTPFQWDRHRFVEGNPNLRLVPYVP